MTKPTVVTLAICSALSAGGCAAHHSEDVLIAEASKEREMSSVRLAKAITRYCSVITETLASRQACIIEQQLAAIPIEEPRIAERTPLPMDPPSRR